MNRFLLTICLALAGIASAWATDIARIDAAPRQETPVAPSGELTLTELPLDARHSKAPQASDSWSEWQTGFTGTADPYVAESLSELFGDQWVEFPERFDILTRENADNPRLVQYKLVNIFNHVDIILDYDRDTQVLSAREQDTGIASPFYSGDDFYYSTYHFVMNGVKMFELSKTVYTRVANNPYFLLIAPNYGYGLDINYFFTFNDLPYYGIGVDDIYQFLSSKETAKTVDLFIPDGVTRYRVVDFTREEYDNGLAASSIYQLYLKEPGEDVPAFTTTTSSTQTLTPEEVLSYRVLIPLDADGKAAHYATVIEVYWNKPLEGEWVAAGTVTLKDNLWGFALDHNRTDYPFLDIPDGEYWNATFTGEAPAVQQLPIETLSTNPSVYRIKNPYGDTHPYRQYIDRPTDPDDDFYLVIDTTDPSQVVFRPTLAGFSRAYYPVGEPFMFDNSNDFFGKMADGKISFPIEAVSWKSGMAYWMQTLLYDGVTLDIEFPGHVDYSMTPGHTLLNHEGLSGDLTAISPNVAKIEYALFDYKLYKDEVQRFPEKLGQMIADRAEGIKVYTAVPEADRTATLRVPLAEVPYGFLSMVAVAVDAQGNHHDSYVIDLYTYNPTPLSMWPKAGNSTANGWFTQGYTFTSIDNTHSVDLRVSPDQEGVYCLYEPFKAEYDYLIENINGAAQTFSYDESEERYFYINASNANNVFISSNPEAFADMEYYDLKTGVSSEAAGDYSIRQIPGSNGRAYVDSRGMEVIDLSGAIRVDLSNIDGYFSCDKLIITIDYDPDQDLTLPANWDDVATVTVEENLLSRCEGTWDLATHRCRLVRNPANDGIYALIDPLRDAGPVSTDWTFDGGEHHMILNLTDPDQVYFDGDNIWDNAAIFTTGYTHSQFGQATLLYMVNAIRNGMFGENLTDATPYYGTATYDEAFSSSLPSAINLDKGIYLCNLSSGNVYTDDASRFRVLIKQAGVDGILAGETAGDGQPVTWYNLQGVRVAAPDQPGVYVRVCGDRSEKVVVR